MQELFNRPDLPLVWILCSYVQIGKIVVEQNILPLRHEWCHAICCSRETGFTLRKKPDLPLIKNLGPYSERQQAHFSQPFELVPFAEPYVYFPGNN